MRIALIVLSLLLAIPGRTSIVFEAASTKVAPGNVLAFEWTHTVTAAANRLMFAMVHASANDSVATITDNGSPMTFVGTAAKGSSAIVHVYSVTNPTAGVHTIDLKMTDSIPAMIGGTVSYSGVDQSSPYGAFVSDNGTGATASVQVSSATNDRVVSFLAWQNTDSYTTSALNGQPERYNNFTTHAEAGEDQTYGVSDRLSTGPTITMTWTRSGGNFWTLGGISVNPSSTEFVEYREQMTLQTRFW